MIIVLFLIGFSSLMMAIGLVCAEKAPVGYEDETGFNFGYEIIGPHDITAAPITALLEGRSDAAKDENIIPLFPSTSLWLQRGIGIAAILVALLILSPERFQNVEKPSSDALVQSASLQQAEFVFEEMPALTVAAVPNESSRFFPTLCARFSQAE